MQLFSLSLASIAARPWRVRLVAILLLLAQLSALLVVPVHAIAHAQDQLASEEAGNPAANSGKVFSSLFGHDQGLGCDEWNAAYALDSHSGVTVPDLPAMPPATTTLSCSFPAGQLATPPRQFLARGPPRL